MSAAGSTWVALRPGCTVEVDARGLNCPLPLLKAKRAMVALLPGQRLSVLATDPGSLRDLSAWAREAGHAMPCAEEDATGFRFVFEKTPPAASA